MTDREFWINVFQQAVSTAAANTKLVDTTRHTSLDAFAASVADGALERLRKHFPDNHKEKKA
jgi:hypothetical protein